MDQLKTQTASPDAYRLEIHYLKTYFNTIVIHYFIYLYQQRRKPDNQKYSHVY